MFEYKTQIEKFIGYILLEKYIIKCKASKEALTLINIDINLSFWLNVLP